ncbi:MAG: tannase/feruloyl esterase family alpha/beta hydrolase [Lachnospiraceae bacterium]
MNQTTRWYEHKLYHWIEENELSSMNLCLKRNCTKKIVESILKKFEHIELENIEFYPSGTYEEEGKTRLDNISDFYLIRMKQRVSKNHTGTMRIYLPINWNHRFMGIAGAGTNNEVDWFTAITFNVITWPMALKNGYACAVSDNDTGIHLDCNWGFDENGNLEWDHIEAWAHKTLHEMTVCAKTVITALYEEEPVANYMHGTSGGGRQVITEALMYPEDYDGLWADGPAIHHYSLNFACLWAAVVEANEKHIVPLSKYKVAFERATSDSSKRNIPFYSRDIIWMDFLQSLLGLPTPDGPITRRDLQVMTKTWNGPFTKDRKRMAYGFGPTIQQWPLEWEKQMYGYFNRREDGKLNLMPIAQQMLRWFSRNPNLDIHSCSYEQFETIYRNSKKDFCDIDFSEADFSAYANRGGKLIITQGTGDCVVPYQSTIDYYNNMLEYFPSEKIMNDSLRMFMPYMAGHSILDWSGAAVSCSTGMRALTDWVENGQAPDKLETVRYNFHQDRSIFEDTVEMFNQWKYKRMIQHS